jgi:hypothetical protein
MLFLDVFGFPLRDVRSHLALVHGGHNFNLEIGAQTAIKQPRTDSLQPR